MQDSKIPLSDEFSIPKSRKKKVTAQKGPLFQVQGNDVNGAPSLPVKAGNKPSKRNLKREVSPMVQQSERSNSNSLPDSSTSGSKYRELRLKYLMMEEESFAVGKDLRDVEEEVKTLEEEKFALLDQLVVLEGLVDPSELHPQGLHSS
ncbi:PREDICTED: uncharacterized protein LOC101314209 [Fragaria vesca subsp. vesca]|uniref:uncharacterized protein LOC101314209 n=1 Tax=Fragaria vesca subsp. vesca TaxID=101020 RepID=UPI0002C3187C|nr:PREDICTED: uncharacterized protein LOC101314209 [Fragaria vesca subsp. vesca]XP_004287696.1 PREDICTED: uncharacterized protein LOC101314209 [Fragaria vesca subsp. vesca]